MVLSLMGFLQRRTLPGFKLAMGMTLMGLSILILLPIAFLGMKASEMSWHTFLSLAFSPRAMAAYRLSIEISLIAALLNTFVGTLMAWVFVRYSFPGKSFFYAMIDLPIALPTSVAGIALTALYSSNGWLGQWFERAGIQVSYTPLGILVALMFVQFPFVVRAVQPVLADLQVELEEASCTLGATRWQTIWHVLFPEIRPAMLTGFAMALARGLGEYGSVIFIAGNLPFRTEIAPLLMVVRLEEFDYAGASAMAVIMLLFAFLLLMVINLIQKWAAHFQYEM